jgi:hypothetical protein
MSNQGKSIYPFNMRVDVLLFESTLLCWAEALQTTTLEPWAELNHHTRTYQVYNMSHTS